MRVAVISDIHLGSSDFQQEEKLLEFLNFCRDLDLLIINGDALDLWRDSFKNLSEKYKKVLVALGFIKHIIYCAGNHDYFMRKFAGLYNNMEIVYPEKLMEINGRKVLITHGHLQAIEWKKMFGFKLMDFYLKIGDTDIAPIIGDAWYKKPVQKLLGHFIKSTSGRDDKTVNYQRKEAFKLAKQRNVDYIIMGHVHFSEIVQRQGITYINTGTWLSSTDYIILDGQQISLRKW